MSDFTDEPVLLKPDSKSRAKLFVALGLGLALAAAVLYVPWSKERMEKLAHYAARGPALGAVYPLQLEGRPYTLELTWTPEQFAPVLSPPPPADIVLSLRSRQGEEVLTWDAAVGRFGPTRGKPIDPYAHHKLQLRLMRGESILWADTLWAYGVHDTHGHSH
jgi:hypothetical protein